MAALLLIAGPALAAPYATPDFSIARSLSAKVQGAKLSLNLNGLGSAPKKPDSGEHTVVKQ